MNKQRFCWILLATLLACLSTAGDNRGEEPATEFLEILRQKRYFDVAEQYLDSLIESGTAPDGFLERIDYERAVILIQGASMLGSPQQRTEQLERAEQHVTKFLTDHPEHPLKHPARGQLGSLLQQRASDNRVMAGNPSQPDRAGLMALAQQQYEQAYQVYSESRGAIRTQLEGMKKFYDPKTEAKEKALLDELRREYLQLQLVTALVLEETSGTAQEGSEKYNECLSKAAEEFNEIYIKYRKRQVGVYALMHEGRCLRKLGKLDDALTNFADVLRQPEDDAFRKPKTLSLIEALQCWTDESQKKYAAAVSQGNGFVATMRANESQLPEWYQLRFLVATVNKLYAEELLAADPKDEQGARSYEEAMLLLRAIIKDPNAYRDDARSMLAGLPGGAKFATDDRPPPTTLDEASQRAKESLEQMNTAELLLKLLPNRIGEETDAGIKAELTTQLDEAATTAKSKRVEAMTYYRMVLDMVDPETPIEVVHSSYYFLAYLNFIGDDFYSSAVFGEFLARRYPESPTAIQGAKIALSCYQSLYREAGEDKTFETDRLVSIARYIAETWSEAPEADEARTKLIPFIIKDGDLDLAGQYIDAMPADSAYKSGSQLRLGRALWYRYRVGTSAYRKSVENGATAAELTAQQVELEKLREAAALRLKAGLTTVSAETPLDQPLMAAQLSLCQYHVEVGEAAKAVALMEEPNKGVLKLTQANDPATQLQGTTTFAQQVYQMALRAYIGDLAGNQDSQQRVDQAKAVMVSLNETVGAEENGKAKLVSIYYRMARDLESQLKLSESLEQRRSLAQGFETFLKEVGQTSGEFNIKNWVAETLNGLGKSFDTDDKLTAEAKNYYDQSMVVLEEIITEGQADAAWLNADPAKAAAYLSQLRLRLARMQRQQRYYQRAINSFHIILQENQMMLEVQVEAANAYAMWAGYGNDADNKPGVNSKTKRPYNTAGYYMTAIGGARKGENGKNVIWGWNRIAQVTASLKAKNPKYNDPYFNARLELAKCRYLHALSKQGDEKKKLMGFAKVEIHNTLKRSPTLGGDLWRPRFDTMLKQIQGALGEPQKGLPAQTTASGG
jgi:hypothetical protein